MPSEVARYCTEIESAYNELVRTLVRERRICPSCNDHNRAADVPDIKAWAARFGLTHVLHVEDMSETYRNIMHESLWDAFANSRPSVAPRIGRLPMRPQF